jgi:hypothetical protein
MTNSLESRPRSRYSLQLRDVELDGYEQVGRYGDNIKEILWTKERKEKVGMVGFDKKY